MYKRQESRLFNIPGVCLKLKCQSGTTDTGNLIVYDLIAQDIKIGRVCRKSAIIIVVGKVDGILENHTVGELNRDGRFSIQRGIDVVIGRNIDLINICRNLPERKRTC